MKLKQESGIRNTGWVPDNHQLEVYVEDDSLHFHLICPPCCCSTANSHILFQEKGLERFGWNGNLDLIGRADGSYFQCNPAYEATMAGLGADTCVDEGWIDEQKKLIAAGKIPEGASAIMEIEHRTICGWGPSTPAGPSEYDWEFSWRPVRTIALVF